MKILTIGPSPYLMTRDGAIHRDVIEQLTAKGHCVEGLVCNHDINYFLSNELGEHHYTVKGENIATLHPYLGEKGDMAMTAYALMKRFQPAVVITIGPYYDSTDIWAIKSLYPKILKWIAIMPLGSGPINENFYEKIEYADRILTTTKAGLDCFGKLNVNASYATYGADLTSFRQLDEYLPEEFGVVTCAKNAQMSNLPAFISGVAAVENLQAYIHTNIDDDGESDLRVLLRRHNLDKRVLLPKEKFVSVREGVDVSLLNEIFNSYHAFVECSMQSATALSLLEAMATGCIPVGMKFGAVGEVLDRLPPEFRIVVDHNVLVGPREEEYAIISITSLIEAMKNLKKRFETDREWFDAARLKSVELSNIFSKEEFLKRLNVLVEDAFSLEHAVVVDSL